MRAEGLGGAEEGEISHPCPFKGTNLGHILQYWLYFDIHVSLGTSKQSDSYL